MQEIFAIVIVAAIVGFALLRRMRNKSSSTGECSGCEHNPPDRADEKPVHFFRNQR